VLRKLSAGRTRSLRVIMNRGLNTAVDAG
jgi:hypothetical protein